MSLNTIPIEIFDQILFHLPTTQLLPLSLTNHRSHSLVTTLLLHRLHHISSLPNHNLILECYHPSEKLSTPYLTCHHLTTITIGDGNKPTDIYSSFLPTSCALPQRPRRRLNRHTTRNDHDEEEEVNVPPFETVHLDHDELFSQLCTIVNVVKPGPRPGQFLSHVNIADGVIRVWRDWLLQSSSSESTSTEDTYNDRKILWLDDIKTIGLRFEITLDAMERMPLISGPDDFPSVSYKLEYKELLLRTTKLLLAAENPTRGGGAMDSGKAIMIVVDPENPTIPQI